MTDLSEAAEEFRDLAKNLIAIGADDLKRELYKAISDAADPLAREIKSAGNLRDHMPDRYADVLAGDLQVTTHKRTGAATAGVTLLARAPTTGRGGRKVRQRDAGVITHPVFAQGPRQSWRWSEVQTAGMKAGFFSTPAERSAPAVRDKILEAMRRVADKATGKG